MRRMIGLVLLIALGASCDLNSPSGPAVTEAEIELFGQFVESRNNGQDLDWGGTLLNRSEFIVQVAVQLEMKNPDDVVFFVTSEHLFQVSPKAQLAFTVQEDGEQIPTPVFSSIAGWNMKKRLVAFKDRTE